MILVEWEKWIKSVDGIQLCLNLLEQRRKKNVEKLEKYPLLEYVPYWEDFVQLSDFYPLFYFK